MFKTVGRVITSVSLLVATGIMIALACIFPDFIFSFYPALSRRLLSWLAGATSVFPFALWEWIAVALVLWLLYSLVRSIIKHRLLRWLAGLLLGVSIGIFLFVGLWGLNHFGPTMAEKLSLDVHESSVEELKQATQYYLTQANALSSQVPRDENKLFDPGSFDTLAEKAADGYRVLARQNDTFNGSTAPVKKLASSSLFAKMGLTGIFVDFTGESCVSTNTYANALPFTMCHEIGHRMGFAAEDEANFAAFLACDANESVIFRYSGYYESFVYCFNALYEEDEAAAMSVWAQANDLVRADYQGAYAHYEKVVSKTASAVSDKINDTYLKAFSESSGTKSYGDVADLLIAWYKVASA